MGFNSGQSDSSEMIDEQYQANQLELEEKKANLYKTRLDIIKSQGGQTWSPDRRSASSGARNNPFKGIPIFRR